MKLSGVHIAADVSRALEEMYGAPGVGEALAGQVGVSQVVAVWRSGDDNTVMRICEETPRSELDFFALNVARARAEAIVTTGQILRDEPDLRHSLQGPGAIPLALAAWRRQRLGLVDPPWVVVLTSGRGLDPDHSVFAAPVRPVVFTDPAGARRLEGSLPGKVELVSHEEPSARALVDWLRSSRGVRRISFEAGPSVASGLYEPPGVVEEILLSSHLEPEIPPSVRGGRFLDRAELEDRFERRSGARVRQDTGWWSFERWLRRP